MKTTRPLDDADRNFLVKKIQVLRFSKLLRIELLLYLFLIGALTALTSLLWNGILHLVGLRVAGVAWIDQPLAFWGVVTIGTGWIFFVTRDLSRNIISAYRDIPLRLQKLINDFSVSDVTEQILQFEAITSYCEPEHFSRFYCLKILDGRILTFFDYESADMEETGKSRRTKFAIHRKLAIVTFPHSGAVNYWFSGEKLRKSRVKTFRAHPKDWPKAEEFCDLSWNELDHNLKIEI